MQFKRLGPESFAASAKGKPSACKMKPSTLLVLHASLVSATVSELGSKAKWSGCPRLTFINTGDFGWIIWAETWLVRQEVTKSLKCFCVQEVPETCHSLSVPEDQCCPSSFCKADNGGIHYFNQARYILCCCRQRLIVFLPIFFLRRPRIFIQSAKPFLKLAVLVRKIPNFLDTLRFYECRQIKAL